MTSRSLRRRQEFPCAATVHASRSRAHAGNGSNVEQLCQTANQNPYASVSSVRNLWVERARTRGTNERDRRRSPGTGQA